VALQVLVVEDEQKVAEALRDGLEDEGYQVVLAHTCGAAQRAIADARFDLVLLDLTLPDGDGLDVLQHLRVHGHAMPVLALSARDALGDRVAGLDRGADDYLVKPFGFSELLARLRALVRRSQGARSSRLTAGDLEMDLVGRRVTRAGQPIDLTGREFDLLKCLLSRAGEVVSREMLVRDVWADTAHSVTLDNVMDVHIARLRRKVDAAHPARLIHTVRGIGFVLREEAL
jgi:DNA-binding response OmpR family regulator